MTSVLDINEVMNQFALKQKVKELQPIFKNPAEVPSHSLGDTWGAAFKSYSSFVTPFFKQSFIDKASLDVDPDFDPVQRLKDLREEDSSPFTESALRTLLFTENEEQFQSMLEFRNEQVKNRRIVAESGKMGMLAGFVAGNFSPVVLLGGYLGLTAKAGIALSVAKGAAIGAGIGVADESILAATTTEYGLDNMALNVGLTAAFGGILGGFAKRMSKVQAKGLQGNLKRIVESDDGSMAYSRAADDYLSDNLKKVDYEQIKHEEGYSYLPNRVIKSAAFLPILRSPLLKGAVHPFATVNKFNNSLFDTPLLLRKELQTGISRGEVLSRTMTRERITMESNFARDYNKLYKESGLKFAEFEKQVHRKVIDGLFDTETATGKAARVVDDIYTKLGDDLVKVGALDEAKLNPKTAVRYLPKRINREYTIANRERFIKIVTKEYTLFDYSGNPRVHKMGEDFVKVRLNAKKAAERTYDNLVRVGDQETAIGTMIRKMTEPKESFLKERTAMIRDTVISDFLDTNVATITSNYINKAVGLKNFRQWLRDIGYRNIEDIYKEIDLELKARLKGVKDAKQINKLISQAEEGKELIKSDIRLLLGIYDGSATTLDKTLSVIRKYQTIAKLGGVVITSLVELLMSPLRFGIKNTYKGYKDYFRSLATDKMAIKDIETHILGLEMYSQTRIKAYDPYALGREVYNPSTSMAWADKVTDVYGRYVSFLTPYTSMGRTIADFAAQRYLIGQMMNPSKLGRARLRSMGISESMESKILAQLKRAAPDYEKTGFINLSAWDPEVRRVMANAVFSEVDNAILIPRAGDIPETVRTNSVMATAFQFKSFSSNATTRVFLSALQRAALKDVTAVMGMTNLIMAGASVYILKARLAGFEPNLDLDNLIYQGAIRSGAVGMFWENALALMPTDSNVRSGPWKFRTAIFGPSYSTMSDVLDLFYGLQDGDLSNEDRKRIYRITPFANVFWLRRAVEKVYGIEKRTRRRKRKRR